ncbi:TadE/TadG family type IV pilus assembly protein [Sandarakinorhabdus sp.]|uniref:TadE/TadG family type IV pilus assembly protein n=1 Tax=Sandarakinorhabdus sp. TaxID=1916663 RepID=UPI00286E1DE0|nr:TadE/TadG family type IV pilus assembly protein [Sandarakinorhabdus sp.]
MMARGKQRRSQRGAVALEAAFCLPPLVLILILAVDTAWISLVQHQVGHAARLASRYGITGQAEAVPEGTARVALCPGAGASGANPRVDRIRAIIAAESAGLLNLADLCLGLGSYAGYQAIGRPEPLADINGNGRHDAGEAFTDINANGSWDADQAVPTPGGGDQIAIYILRYTAHPLVGLTPGLGGDIPIETRVVVRNEPF